MTVLGYHVSEEAAKKISDTEEAVSRRIMFCNEPLEGEEKILLTSQGNYFYFANFDMNRIDINDEFEPLILKMMDEIIAFDLL